MSKPNLNLYLSHGYDFVRRRLPAYPGQVETFYETSELDRSESMAERIVRIIIRYISENQLLPGDQLPAEKKAG